MGYYMANGKTKVATAQDDVEMGQAKVGSDAPGAYIIKHPCSVQATLSVGGATTDAIAELPVGKQVQVVEVVALAKMKRIRARIENPSGWISLRNTESGHRWAAKI